MVDEISEEEELSQGEEEEEEEGGGGGGGAEEEEEEDRADFHLAEFEGTAETSLMAGEGANLSTDVKTSSGDAEMVPAPPPAAPPLAPHPPRSNVGLGVGDGPRAVVIRKPITRFRMKRCHYAKLVDYIEDPENFQALVDGVGGGGRKSTRFRMKPSDYAKIVEYIEDPENFQALHGKKRKIGGKVQTKAAAFKSMAIALVDHGFPRLKGGVLQKKFERFVENYKRAREVKEQAGGGLSEAEIAAGVSLEDKLNKICPCFHRMHAIYGPRRGTDISPPALLNTGFGGEDDQEEPGDNAPISEKELAELVPEAHQVESPHDIVEGIIEGADSDDFLDELEGSGRQNFPGDVGNSPADVADRVVGTTQPFREPGLGSTLEEQPAHRSTLQLPLVSQPDKIRRGSGAATTTIRVYEKPNTSEGTLVSLCQEKHSMKSEFQNSLVESKERWKLAELEDRREARLEAAAASAKKARIDKSYELQMARLNSRTQLLIELVRAGKNEDEIKRYMSLLEAGF